MGGHLIPDAGVRRRYARSIANAAQALRVADIATFHDNSGDAHRLILVINAGIVVWQAEPIPEWVKLWPGFNDCPADRWKGLHE